MLTAILAPIGYYAYAVHEAAEGEAFLKTYCGMNGGGYGSSTCEAFNAQR